MYGITTKNVCSEKYKEIKDVGEICLNLFF